ncbi:LCP family protein, partial [Actinopolyspora mortivallis]
GARQPLRGAAPESFTPPAVPPRPEQPAIPPATGPAPEPADDEATIQHPPVRDPRETDSRPSGPPTEVTGTPVSPSGPPPPPPTPKRGTEEPAQPWNHRPAEGQAPSVEEAPTRHEPLPAVPRQTDEPEHAVSTEDGGPEAVEEESPPEEDAESDEDRANSIDSIDATLARFSAVHDELAAEEAKKRKRFAWLFGERKEPEPGQDMPFDFTSDREGSSSRVEWRRHKRRRRLRRTVKSLATLAAVLVFVGTGIGWGSMTWWDSSFVQVPALFRDSASIQNPEMQEGDLNFLLIGSDTREGAERGDDVGTAETVAGARSDTTMIAHIPADRSRVVVVSIPRDLEIDIPADTCAAWDAATGEYTDSTVPARNNVKFNAVYAEGGPQCVTKKVQQLSGLEITNFLGINFQGFKSMVDAVGGVRICTNKPLIDRELGPVLETAGWHELGGQQALQYVRARKVVGDATADYGRMERQQMFLSALLRKMTSADVLLSPGKLNDLANAVISNTFGENVDSGKLIALGNSLEGLDPEKVTFVTVPTTGESNARGNEVLRESAAHSLFRAIIEDKPIAPSSGEKSKQAGSPAQTSPMADAQHTAPAQTEPSQATSGPSPQETNVRVLNATDRTGLAGEVSEKLREFDYSVLGTDTLDTAGERTVVRYSEGHRQQAELLASSVPAAELMQDASAGDGVRLELGADFDGRVLQPDTGDVEVPDGLWTVNAGKDVCGGVN